MSIPVSASVYTDFSGLTELKAQAANNSPEALRAAAKQFEALFVQMMLKSMRDASLAEGILDNDQTEFYQDMFDKQISLELGEGRGFGLADTLVRQLSGTLPTPEPGGVTGPLPDFSRSFEARPVHSAPVSRVDADWQPGSPAEFVGTLWPHAQQAAARLGVDPEVLLAQSALETGWGQSVMQHADGRSSYNLFGIKADGSWQGDRVNLPTLEFEQGVAVRKKAAFRAYQSLADSFQDYVSFLQNNPRYRQTLNSASDRAAFVQELQDAGYATDPRYAQKITSIMGSDRFQSALDKIRPGGAAPPAAEAHTSSTSAADNGLARSAAGT